MNINRFLPLLVPFFSWMLLEIFYFFPNGIYVIAVIFLLLNFFSYRQFIRAGKKQERWWNFVILPFLLFLGSMLFISPLTIGGFLSKIFVHGLFFANLIFLYNYYRSTYYLLIEPDLYQKNSLENFASFGGFLSFFFLASFLYGLQTLVGVATWLLMLFMLLLVALEVYHVLWANKIEKNKKIFFLPVISLILIELAWTLSFLSLSYYILGIILSLYFYIIIGLSRFFLKNQLNKKLIRTFLLFGFLSIMVILLTAHWYG